MSHIADLGELHVRFSSEDPSVERRWAELYAAFPSVSAQSERHSTTDIRVDPETRNGVDGWAGFVDEAFVRWSEHLPLVEEVLTRRINRLALDAESDWLHLHAGAAERDGSTVLIVGPSGAGKSTLTAALVQNGWSLLGDEQVGVLPDGRLLAFPRPTTLRRASWNFFPEIRLPAPVVALERYEVPVGVLGASYQGPSKRPTLIVRPDALDELGASTRFTSAEAMRHLLADTLDMERAGDDGIAALLALAAGVAAISIPGPDLAKTIETIERALDERGESGGVSRTSHVEEQPGDARTAGARGWLFDDGSAVIYDPTSGIMIEVDRTGFDDWEQLGAPTLGTTGSQPFRDELRIHGLCS